ncbi:MAG: hypothetical protein ABJN78_02765, partial [Hyphomicrobiales bacterium]
LTAMLTPKAKTLVLSKKYQQARAKQHSIARYLPDKFKSPYCFAVRAFFVAKGKIAYTRAYMV